MKEKWLHITHNDSDALGCALIVEALNTGSSALVETQFCKNGIMPSDMLINALKIAENNDMIYKKIFISDISVSEEALVLAEEYKERMNDQGFEVQLFGFDHHLTNHANEKHDWFIVKHSKHDETYGDILISACEIMFDELESEMTKILNEECGKVVSTRALNGLYQMVHTISRYDTWTWKNNPSYTKEQQISCAEPIFADIVKVNPETLEQEFAYLFGDDFYAISCKCFGIQETFDVFRSIWIGLAFYYIDDDVDPEEPIDKSNLDNFKKYLEEFIYPEKFCTAYSVQKKREESAIKYAEKRFKFRVINEYIVGEYINNDEFSNAVIDHYKSIFPFVDYFIIYYPNTEQIGLRTGKDYVDVSLIASRLFGGGGHKQAAGAKFETMLPLFVHLLSHYYLESVSFTDLQSWVMRNPEFTEDDFYHFLNDDEVINE